MLVAASDSLGIYISIPFCRSKCTYCNFASGVYPAALHKQYIDRVLADMAAAPAWAANTGVELPRIVDSIYLGGGTPSLLSPNLLLRLFASIHSEFDVLANAEVTVECAPGQISDEFLAAMAHSSVNRVSLGVQSFIDREVSISGRLHNRATVLEDLRRFRSTGIENISVDLIAGLAAQTSCSWRDSLAALLACGTAHASVYMLEVDEDSRLGRELLIHGARYHAAKVPGDDAIAAMYLEAIETLGAAGLGQYEISNFCRPGFASRHNLRYWERRPYLGLGLDASSMLRELPRIPLPRVLRTTATAGLDAYLAGRDPGETTWLSPFQQHEEAWFLGLRTNAGVNADHLVHEFGSELVEPAVGVAARLAHEGMLSFDGITATLTSRGRLLSNDVFQQFLDLPASTPTR